MSATSRPPAFDPKFAREEMTPARIAALDRMQLLIDKDPQAALFHFASSGSTEGLRLAVEAGADINAKHKRSGYTVALLAACIGEPAILEEAVRLGGNINARAPDGNTPVIEAARFDEPAILEAAVRLGGDLNATNWRGETALSFAKDNGNTEIARAIKGLLWDQHTQFLEHSFAGPLLKPVLKAFKWLDGR